MNVQPSSRPSPGSKWPGQLASVAMVVLVVALAGATFVLSYTGVHQIVLAAGVSKRLARIYPGLLDAVLVVACAAALVLRDARVWAKVYAWVSIVVLVALVGAADAVHAMGVALPHRAAEGTVAALPWALVMLGFSLWLTMLRHARAAVARPEPSERASGSASELAAELVSGPQSGPAAGPAAGPPALLPPPGYAAPTPGYAAPAPGFGAQSQAHPQAASQGGYPNAGYAQGGYPQAGYSQSGYGYAQHAYPQQAYPQQDFPQQDFPQYGQPASGYQPYSRPAPPAPYAPVLHVPAPDDVPGPDVPGFDDVPAPDDEVAPVDDEQGAGSTPGLEPDLVPGLEPDLEPAPVAASVAAPVAASVEELAEEPADDAAEEAAEPASAQADEANELDRPGSSAASTELASQAEPSADASLPTVAPAGSSEHADPSAPGATDVPADTRWPALTQWPGVAEPTVDTETTAQTDLPSETDLTAKTDLPSEVQMAEAADQERPVAEGEPLLDPRARGQAPGFRLQRVRSTPVPPAETDE